MCELCVLSVSEVEGMLTTDAKSFFSLPHFLAFFQVAKTMCELCVLSVSDFENMLTTDANFFHVVTKVVNSHVDGLYGVCVCVCVCVCALCVLCFVCACVCEMCVREKQTA